MTQYAYEIDDEGFIINNYIVDGPVEVPEGCITVQLPEPAIYYKNRWDKDNWVEGATQDEIDEMIKPQPRPPSLEEQLVERDKQIQLLKEQQLRTDADLAGFMDFVLMGGM